MTNDFWINQATDVKAPFSAFSAAVYLPGQDIAIIGGLDDSVPNKPSFRSSVTLISEVPLNSYDNKYVEKRLPDMNIRRGCMASLYHEGYIYVFGGLNYTEKILKKCERLLLVDHITEIGKIPPKPEKWNKIADMKECRKNASAISMSADILYVIGGSSNTNGTLDTIEQYSISCNRW